MSDTQTIVESTLRTRLHLEWKTDGESEWWEAIYKPTTIAFDPSIIMLLPTFRCQSMPNDFVAHLANMVAAVDCEVNIRGRGEVFEEVIRICYDCFGDEDQSGNDIQVALDSFTFKYESLPRLPQPCGPWQHD